MIAHAGKPAILVTDAGYRNTLAAVRALSSAGYAVDAVGPPGGSCESSRHLRNRLNAGASNGTMQIDAIENLLSTYSYAAMLPIGGRSVEFVANHADRIANRTNLALASPESVETCMDKAELNVRAARIGLNVPRFWTLDSDADVQRVADEARFPVVIKKRHELDRGPLIIVDCAAELLDTTPQWRSAHAESRFAPIAQEYVAGDGCALFALYDHGTLKRAFMHRRVREYPAIGGASSCAESTYEEDLYAEGKRLLDDLSWHGVAMVEFKRDRSTRQLCLMEVNPKFWGSLDLAIAAGVNFPVDTVRIALGESLERQCDYAVGLRFHWPFGHGEWLHVMQRPRSAWPVIRDCLDPRVRTNFRWNDPAPTWREIRQDLRELGRRKRAGMRR